MRIKYQNNLFAKFLFFYCLTLLGFLVLPLDPFIRKQVFQYYIVITILVELFSAFLRKSIFRPRFIIVFVFLFNGLIGGANLFQRGAFVDYFNEFYHLIFYIFFTIGYLLFPSKRVQIGLKSNRKLKSIDKVAFSITILGVISILVNWILLGGIPIFHGEEFRMGSNPFFSLLFFLGSVSSIYLMIERKKKVVLLMIILSFLTGYRSTSIILILIILFNYLFFNGSISYKKKILISVMGVILFTLINMIKFYRDINYYGLDRFIEIAEKQGSSTTIYLLPFISITNTIIEGPSVFQRIRDNIGDDFGYGTYYLETVTTFLPGPQRDYGAIYNNITKAPTENTKTATILSASYIEFGLAGIVIMGLIIGLTIKCCYQLALCTKNIALRLLFANYFSWLVLWIHSGYVFSLVFISICILLTFIASNK